MLQGLLSELLPECYSIPPDLPNREWHQLWLRLLLLCDEWTTHVYPGVLTKSAMISNSRTALPMLFVYHAPSHIPKYVQKPKVYHYCNAIRWHKQDEDSLHMPCSKVTHVRHHVVIVTCAQFCTVMHNQAAHVQRLLLLRLLLSDVFVCCWWCEQTICLCRCQ